MSGQVLWMSTTEVSMCIIMCANIYIRTLSTHCQVIVYFYCYRWPWMKLRILTTGGVPKIDTVTSIILWPNKCLEFSILFPLHWLQNLIPGNLGNHTFYATPFGRPSLHLSSCSAFLPESYMMKAHCSFSFCPAFSKGSCKHRDKYKLNHIDVSNIPCKFNQQNTCNFGADCIFHHAPKPAIHAPMSDFAPIIQQLVQENSLIYISNQDEKRQKKRIIALESAVFSPQTYSAPIPKPSTSQIPVQLPFYSCKEHKHKNPTHSVPKYTLSPNIREAKKIKPKTYSPEALPFKSENPKGYHNFLQLSPPATPNRFLFPTNHVNPNPFYTVLDKSFGSKIFTLATHT